MKKYNFSTFMTNMGSIGHKIEKQKKKEEIGKVLSSLQRPFTDVLRAVCEKQKKDVDELYKQLGWEKKF